VIIQFTQIYVFNEFINLQQLNFKNGEMDFAELIYRSGLTFVIKHKKDFISQYSQSNRYGSYSKLHSVKYIRSGDQLIKVQTCRSFMDFFDPYRKQIKKYLRANKINYRNASKNELFGLLKFCDELPEEK